MLWFNRRDAPTPQPFNYSIRTSVWFTLPRANFFSRIEAKFNNLGKIWHAVESRCSDIGYLFTCLSGYWILLSLGCRDIGYWTAAASGYWILPHPKQSNIPRLGPTIHNTPWQWVGGEWGCGYGVHKAPSIDQSHLLCASSCSQLFVQSDYGANRLDF